MSAIIYTDIASIAFSESSAEKVVLNNDIDPMAKSDSRRLPFGKVVEIRPTDQVVGVAKGNPIVYHQQLRPNPFTRSPQIDRIRHQHGTKAEG